jgi:hypothetical protein
MIYATFLPDTANMETCTLLCKRAQGGGQVKKQVQYITLSLNRVLKYS